MKHANKEIYGPHRVAALVEAGYGRGAAKLRTALGAAYQLAVDSGTDPDVPL